jgi:hypothetical protein
MLESLVEIMKCTYYIPDNNEHYPICRMSDHHPLCEGYAKDCDKEINICTYAIWQGCEIYCRKSQEMTECRADMDFCTILKKEKT